MQQQSQDPQRSPRQNKRTDLTVDVVDYDHDKRTITATNLASSSPSSLGRNSNFTPENSPATPGASSSNSRSPRPLSRCSSTTRSSSMSRRQQKQHQGEQKQHKQKQRPSSSTTTCSITTLNPPLSSKQIDDVVDDVVDDDDDSSHYEL